MYIDYIMIIESGLSNSSYVSPDNQWRQLKTAISIIVYNIWSSRDSIRKSCCVTTRNPIHLLGVVPQLIAPIDLLTKLVTFHGC